ncbi:MAG: hypothetical protein KA807_14320 [Prolixibacteraceae bacterium]|nr:hypothetical protein [Prolixibacteraceae bacterium]
MKINRNNYESFFIDYLDGNLTPLEIDELIDFLRKNNDLAEELKGLDKIRITDNEIIKYEGQSLFKEDIDMPDVSEEQCIRFIEGDLNPDEKKEFLISIKNKPRLKKELTLYKSSILIPDHSIIYKSKNKLLKTENPFILKWWNVAAILIVMFAIFSKYDEKPKEVIVAEINESFTTSNDVKTNIDDALFESPKIPVVKINKYKPAITSRQIKTEVEDIIYFEPAKDSLTELKISRMTPLENILVYSDNKKQDFELISVSNNPSENEKIKYLTIGEFIAQKLNEFASRENLNKIRNSALESIKDASEERFKYTTNISGEVKSIEYQSRLFAFSIPLTNR